MAVLPVGLMTIIGVFAPVFTERVWRHIPVLLGGAILALGKRMITSVLRVMGLGPEPRFHNSHRVLSRASWSALRAGRVLLEILIDMVAPTTPLGLGLDDTIERRRDEQIAAKRSYRNLVRSSQGHFVKASGLAVVECYAAGTRALGTPGVGATGIDGAIPVGTLLRQARPETPG